MDDAGEDVRWMTYDQLASLRDQTSSVPLSDGLGLLSLALTDLRLLEAALPRRRLTKPIVTRMEAEGVDPLRVTADHVKLYKRALLEAGLSVGHPIVPGQPLFPKIEQAK